MTLTLDKGQPLSLSKEAPGLANALIGLGWDARTTAGDPFDLDACALLLNAHGKVRSDDDFVFYGQAKFKDSSGRIVHPDGVVHLGDNRTGAGDGDDEQITVDLTALPADVDKIVFTASIYDAGQNFGQVRNAYIRIVDQASGTEIARYDLGEDAAVENAVNFAELYRYNGEWKFRAVGQGYTNGLGGIATDFGVNL
jgi:tellurium resistance protein TerD